MQVCLFYKICTSTKLKKIALIDLSLFFLLNSHLKVGIKKNSYQYTPHNNLKVFAQLK